ncbi:MAG: flagellar hook-length control protein FliK [Clostridiaceae bacterium]|nr:flagellar hook-length control protein FliK [Clostridiaceae bacterium]
MKIDGFISNIDTTTLNMSDLLRKLDVGDIVRARVLDITANELTLKLLDGTVFSAKTMSVIDAKQGEIVDFVVKNNSNAQLVLETLKENEYKQNSTLESSTNLKLQLMESNIKPDINNLEIAKEIKHMNLQLNKDTFDKIADAITVFKNLTPQKAAFLLSNNIKLEEKNISLLNQIVDEKQKVTPLLKETFEAFSKLTSKDTMESILNILKQYNTQSDTQNNTQINTQINTPNLFNNKQEFISHTLETVFNSYNQEESSILSEIKENLLKFVDSFLEDNSLGEMKLNTADKMFTNKALLFLKENVKDLISSDLYKEKTLDNSLKELFYKLKANADKENNASKLDTPLRDLTKNFDYKKELEDALDKFYVRVDEKTSADDLKTKMIYKDMYEKLEMIKHAVKQSNELHKNEVLNKIENLQNNLKFINDLNNHSTYVQIPLNILSKNTTGELYVLKKGSKGKKIDPQNASVLISLNTPNLGQIDSLINVNRKNISLSIRVEEQSIIGFIKGYYIQLYNSLLDKGYKLVDVKYRLIEEEINPLNAEQTITKELNLNNQSIDFKI